jgi:hypothetical protein
MCVDRPWNANYNWQCQKPIKKMKELGDYLVCAPFRVAGDLIGINV